ncbi:MAG: Uma2 family endonuclease, partial [uncultured Thiotrichaceae bacterium]
ALRTLSRGSSCTAYQSDIKVRATHFKSYFYPDVVVGCDDDDADDYYLEKPCLIVEVLSDSTEKRDRREKLLAYMNIPSLQAYLLVAQDRPEVELYYREAAGNWWVQVFENPEDEVMLPCVDRAVTLTEIYEDVFGNAGS